MDFTRIQICPVFYDYVPVYEIWIQYITVFKRYRPETIFHSEIKGRNSDNNWWILSIIELDLYFMITYLCMKYEFNTPMFSKDIARKPFSYVRDVCTYGRTDKGDAICPPPIINGGGIMSKLCENPAMLFHVDMIYLANQAKLDVEKSLALRWGP